MTANVVIYVMAGISIGVALGTALSTVWTVVETEREVRCWQEQRRARRVH